MICDLNLAETHEVITRSETSLEYDKISFDQ